MSDCPKSSRAALRLPGSRRTAGLAPPMPAATTFFEVSPFALLLAAELAGARARETAAALPPHAYSIRVATSPGAPCATCRTPTGHGPVGFRNEEPVCDGCLLDAAPPLGLTLCLVAVTRAFAVARLNDSADASMALAELGAFARIFERIASTWGPARRFDDPADGRRS